jgi:hypothetical protein
MNFYHPSFQLNPEEYSYIISIGNKCLSRMALNDLGLAKASFPFDYIPISPFLILKYMQDQSGFLPELPYQDRNADGVWFGHFDLTPEGRPELEAKFKRRFERLKEVLASGQKVLFLYTSESDTYNEMGSRLSKGENYICIKQLVSYIHYTYPASNFDVLCIHTNDERPNEIVNGSNIYNLTVYVSGQHLSANMETHVHQTIAPYRLMVTKLLKAVFLELTQEDIDLLKNFQP